MHFKNRLLIFLLTLSLQVCAQVQPSELPQLPFPEQCHVIDSLVKLRTSGISAKAELYEPYIDAAIEADENQLLSLLELSKMNFTQNSGWEMRETIREIIYKSKKRGWKEIEAIGYQKMANFYRAALGDHEARLKYMLLSHELYKDWEPERFIFKGKYLFDLANSYRYFKDFENALPLYRKAHAISDADVNLNTIGLAYIEASKGIDSPILDTALRYLDLAYQQAHRENRRLNKDIATGNKISVYIIRKQYDTALSLTNEVYERMNRRHAGIAMRGNLLATVGYLNYKQGNLQIANTYLNRALDTFRSFKQWPFERMQAAGRVYDEMSELQAVLGNYRLAYLYADTMRRVKDSLRKKTNIAKVKNTEKDIAKAKLFSSEEELKYQRENAIQTRNMLIVIVVSSAIIMVLLINTFRSRQKKLKDAKLKVDTEAEQLKDQLGKITTNIKAKNQLLENLQQQLSNYQYTEDVSQYQDTVSELRRSTLLTDEDWANFRDAFERVHVGYLSRLAEKHPELTPSEIRYIVLAKLGMNNKEMASVLGVSAGSIRTLKSRMIKKLAYTDEQQLHNLIETV